MADTTDTAAHVTQARASLLNLVSRCAAEGVVIAVSDLEIAVREHAIAEVATTPPAAAPSSGVTLFVLKLTPEQQIMLTASLALGHKVRVRGSELRGWSSGVVVEADPAVTPPWKCKTCGTMNVGTRTDCTNCECD